MMAVEEVETGKKIMDRIVNWVGLVSVLMLATSLSTSDFCQLR